LIHCWLFVDGTLSCNKGFAGCQTCAEEIPALFHMLESFFHENCAGGFISNEPLAFFPFPDPHTSPIRLLTSPFRF